MLPREGHTYRVMPVLRRLLKMDDVCYPKILTNPERAALTAAIDALQRQGESVAIVIPNNVGIELAWINPPSAGRPPPGTKLYALPPQPPIPSPFAICPKCRDEYAYCECPQPPTWEQTS